MSVEKMPSCSFWMIYLACGVEYTMNHIINSKYTTQVPVSGERSNMVCAIHLGRLHSSRGRRKDTWVGSAAQVKTCLWEGAWFFVWSFEEGRIDGR